MTKEQLLARQADLERQLAQSRGAQAEAAFQIKRQANRLRRARDTENAVGGALGEVVTMIGELEARAKESSE